MRSISSVPVRAASPSGTPRPRPGRCGCSRKYSAGRDSTRAAQGESLFFSVVPLGIDELVGLDGFYITEKQYAGGLSVQGDKANRIHLRVGSFELLMSEIVGNRGVGLENRRSATLDLVLVQRAVQVRGAAVGPGYPGGPARVVPGGDDALAAVAGQVAGEPGLLR